MNRRHFLSMLAMAAASRPWPAFAQKLATQPTTAPPPIFPLSTAQLQDQVLEDLHEFGAFRLFYTATHSDPKKSHFVVVNTGSNRVEMAIPISLENRHSVVPSPGLNPSYALIPELDGTKAVLVSLIEKNVAAEVTPSLKDHWFSGHACFSLDGKTVYLPESPLKEGTTHGMLVARSVPELKVERTFETGHFRPHNLLLSKDGNRMMVGHYGYTPLPGSAPIDGGIGLLELETGKILPSKDPEVPNLTLCHLERDDEENVMISTRTWMGKDNYKPAPVLFGTMKAEKWDAEIPDAFRSRFLSNFSLRLAKKAGVLAVAHKGGSLLSFWAPKKHAFLEALDLQGETPLGVEITPDERFFVVNTTAGGLLFIDVKTRKIAKRSFLIGIGFCPHIALVPGNAFPDSRSGQKQL